MPSSPPRADAEPSWGPSSAALTPCPSTGQEKGSKQADGHQRFLCLRLIKNPDCGDPTFNSGSRNAGEGSPSKGLRFSLLVNKEHFRKALS